MVSNSKNTEATEKFKRGFGILRILQKKKKIRFKNYLISFKNLQPISSDSQAIYWVKHTHNLFNRYILIQNKFKNGPKLSVKFY